MIYVFTGDGKGKTSAALGMAFRVAGYGYKSVIIQFMKARETGEILKAKSDHLIDIYQYGKKEWVDFDNLSDKDYKLAEEGLARAQNEALKKPFLLILDEFNLVVRNGLVGLKRAIDFLKKESLNTHIVLTGRDAPREFINLSDLVTECKAVKHPFEKGTQAVKGLDY